MNSTSILVLLLFFRCGWRHYLIRLGRALIIRRKMELFRVYRNAPRPCLSAAAAAAERSEESTKCSKNTRSPCVRKGPCKGRCSTWLVQGLGIHLQQNLWHKRDRAVARAGSHRNHTPNLGPAVKAVGLVATGCCDRSHCRRALIKSGCNNKTW